MEVLDIIFLIATLGIGYFLYSILGKRTGHQPSEPSVDIFSNKKTVEVQTNPSSLEPFMAPPLITGVKQLKQLDPKFEQTAFLNTVRVTFESIINAFVKGDLELLKQCLTPELYNTYAKAIEDRNREKQHAELTFFRFIRAEIKDIQLKDFLASIRINFISEQSQVLKDAHGKILEGDSDMLDEINEMWVFERDMNSKNTHWVLAETYAP
jgi:predicted lipid-binding transport protein (Tim44 family)